ncbi:MAG: ATP-binding protein [Blastocatellia bacterium]
MSSSFAESWNRFADLLQKFDQDLVIELETCYKDIEKITQLQTNLNIPDLKLQSINLEEFLTNYQEIKQNFFTNIIVEWEKKRPYKRALIAIEGYDRKIQELTGSLPSNLNVTSKEVLAVIGELVAKGWQRKIVTLSKKEKNLAFNIIIAKEIEKIYQQQSRIIGYFLQSFAQLILRIKEYWEDTHHNLSTSILEKSFSDKDLAKSKLIIKIKIEKLCKECKQSIEKLKNISAKSAYQIGKKILSGLIFQKKTKKSNSTKYKEQSNANLFYWSKLIESVETDLRLEQKIQVSELKTFQYIQIVLNNAIQERDGVLLELDQAIAWLKDTGESKEKFPSPVANIIPAASRLQEFENNLQRHWNNLPNQCELVAKFSNLPPSNLKLQQLYPHNKFQEAFLRSGKEKIFSVLTNIEVKHRKITQYVEQAREVISFHLGIAQLEDSFEVTQEALKNALSLLEFCQQEAIDWYSQANKEMVQAVVSFYSEGRLLLSQDKIGVLTYLAQQNVEHLLPIIRERFLEASKKLLSNTTSYAKQAVQSWLISIGWMREPIVGQSSVIIRPFLPKEFSIDIQNLSLPALYRHLFRFEPVEDPRFLVGRDKDIQALAEAKEMWDKDKPVSILIVGERGSGKTSLINCAVKQILKDHIEIIQDEFRGRIINELQLHEFLAKLIKIDDVNLLTESLSQKQRIIILEETERIYLRQVGHYGALRALQRLITLTSKTTLWILCINKTAFDLLNVTIQLGETFSHRINVGVASKEVMKNALLLRHNLSGLRLQIAAPEDNSNWLEKLNHKYLNPINPTEVFFDTLTQESGGVFRAAFKIWLGHIESIQAGLLTMKAIVKPDRNALIEDLDLQDLFTLVAILQHGSLTYEEHSAIFQTNISRSKLQIHELIDRQIVELEPQRSGYRVSADAMPVVKELLYRRNLI